MINKDLIGGDTDNPLAFVARVVRTAETASEGAKPIVATSYLCEETGALVVTNHLPSVVASPFTGKPMIVQETAKPVDLDPNEMDDSMIAIARVESDKGSFDILTLKETAALINGEQFHCPITGQILTASVAEEAPAGDEKPTETSGEETAAETSEEAPTATEEKPADETAGDDDVESLEEEEENEEVEDDGDDEELEDEDDDDDAGDDDNEEESCEASIQVDLTAEMDIDPRTLVIASVSPVRSVLIAFDHVSNQPQAFGYLNHDKFAPEVAKIADKGNSLRNALVASITEGNNLSPLGFEPIVHEVKIDALVAKRIEDAETAAQETASVSVTDGLEILEQSLGIAVAGMNKGLYDNPLVVGLTNELAQLGLQNAEVVASRIVESCADNYMRSAIVQAKEIAKLGSEAREYAAKQATAAKSVFPSSKGDRNTVHMATANLARIASGLETASFGSPETPKPAKRLFSTAFGSAVR